MKSTIRAKSCLHKDCGWEKWIEFDDDPLGINLERGEVLVSTSAFERRIIRKEDLIKMATAYVLDLEED